MRELGISQVDITVNVVHNDRVETKQSQGLTLTGPSQPSTIDDWANEWHDRRLQDGKTERHVKQVCRYVRACSQRNGWVNPQDMNEQGVRLWLMELKGRGGDKPPSAHLYNNCLASMKTFCRFLKRCRVITENPCDFIDMRPKDEVDEGYRAISVDELVALIAFAQTRRGGQEAAAVYLFTFWTGMRRSEVRELCVRNVVLDAEQPRIDWAPGETKGSKRTGRIERIPLFDALVVDIVRARMRGKGPDDRIFTVPRQDVFKRDAERAGLVLENPDGKLVFHSLRKGLATALAMADVPPSVTQAIMRHRQLQTTNRVYIDKSLMPTAQALRSTYEKIWGSQSKKLLTSRPIPDSLDGTETSGDQAMVAVATTPAASFWEDGDSGSSPVSPIPTQFNTGSQKQTDTNQYSGTAGPVATGSGAAVPALGFTAGPGFSEFLSLSSSTPLATAGGEVSPSAGLGVGSLPIVGDASRRVVPSSNTGGPISPGSNAPSLLRQTFFGASAPASVWVGACAAREGNARGVPERAAAGSTPARSVSPSPSASRMTHSATNGAGGLSQTELVASLRAVSVLLADVVARLERGG